MLGKLFHLTVDAILISALLAGIKRNTGIAPSLDLVPSRDVRGLLNSYLEVGEYAFDFTVVFLSRSRYFSRHR
ncbi:hypothetical protein FRB91_008783 [Serendipita sp. 411]|nr:hypothetical protein FRC19_002514 [Serendipita sp. 401]KAG8831209.1 hypothetical protein FRC18_006972 [Serendipita sp. 400]KAG8850805.1 hypothetical protein FRB91_008783 [Serendipita sp. 411]